MSGKTGRKFSRKKDQRTALMRSLLSSLFEKGRITTTLAKAREIKRTSEKIITKSKTDDLATRRLLRKSFSEKTIKNLIEKIGKEQKERKGGYTRVMKLGQRKTDGAEMAIIEIIK